ncbi:hypothetical protein [Burkholderia cepacia]|uniref:hypothetical protein n=1 Tax=Burkholderia cepacia TaxID=292 RepID=UPI0012D8B1D0|nr:hypothetical protein [Burkholderia cepacia]
MSSIDFGALIEEFPEEAESLRRLATFFSSMDNAPRARELTVQRVFDVARPSSQHVLLKMLQRLVQQGALEKVVRVESDALGGIGDFPSVSDVPHVMFDPRIGHEIEVRPDQLRLMYKVNPAREAH